jgi:hypothetical protein
VAQADGYARCALAKPCSRWPIQNFPNGEFLAIASEPEGKRLSRAEFQGLGEMPPEVEWFANLDNPRTRRAYRNDVKEFTAFAGVGRPEEMRQVTRAHLIAWL